MSFINIIGSIGRVKLFGVAQNPTWLTRQYLGWDVIWMFHNSYDAQYDNNNPLCRMQFNHDWETIADLAVGAGNVNAVCTHVIDQSGFEFFDSDVRFNDGVAYGIYPTHGFNWGLRSLYSQGITSDHLSRYVSAFKQRNIKVGFYIPLGINVNLKAETGYGFPDIYAAYNVDVISWLQQFKPDFFWLDNPQDIRTEFTATHKQNIYDAAKNGKSIVMANFSYLLNQALYGGSVDYFPVDVYQQEKDWFYNDEGVWGNNFTVDEIQYYLVPGFTYSGLYKINNSTLAESIMYPWWNNPPADGYTRNLVRDQSEFDQWYSFCKTKGVPFNVNVPIDPNNSIDATYLNRLSNLIV